MAEASDTLGILYQNLLDAGCDEKTAECCMAYAKCGEWRKMLPLLSKHKTILLEIVHAGQKQIDCLDFLIYRINKEDF
ncbi:hypothetical protein DWX43_05715 [Clostridium sp. AF19-22AC]|jgi:hypothetical protein|uniref:hypothetical protein n=1 Tax=Clostridia TaxID=186801 RepID=UPI000E54021A|nr:MULTISPECIES: hypothetical protein [Clostridia]RHR31208.1 hypothetical protein DWX43_05715 [Clostridium sp. AF19-22AC]